MLELFSHQNHIPSRPEDGLVALFLPEVDIKLPVGEFAPNDTRFPYGPVAVVRSFPAGFTHDTILPCGQKAAPNPGKMWQKTPTTKPGPWLSRIHGGWPDYVQV